MAMADVITAVEEEVIDPLWEEMKILATEQQQCLYELLPDCTIYKTDEHKYLRQNIGYAIYGPPKSSIEDASTTENNESSCYCITENPNGTDAADTDASDTVGYDEKATTVIDLIYKQICTWTIEIDDSQPIYFGIIYNMIFRPKNNVKSEKKEIKKEPKNETETEVKEEAKEDESLIVSPIPIFTIRKSIQEKSDSTNGAKQENTPTADETQYEIWYIDCKGRVYKNWANYIEKNTLPKCTMVLPKDGFYQANPSYPCTEDCSTVWLEEIMESPACTLTATLIDGMDTISSVVALGTLGLSIASMFTPLGPVVLATSLAAASVTGGYSVGRNIQQLADRSSHEESIHPFDREVLPHYLGIAGTAFGLGAVGGSAIISNVASRGMTVNTFARVAFNTVQGGNLLLNGVGVIYQGYCMIDKYNNGESVTIGDALNLATHIMFFYGSVVKVQFANDIIESTQGRVMKDYKENLSNKRLRKKYNRIVRKAAESNTCKISENAEVIRYIRHRQELLSNQSVTKGGSRISDNTSHNTVSNWSFEDGKLKVNDIVLLDPIKYVNHLIKLGIFIEMDQNNSFDSQNDANNSMTDQLREVLRDLLSNFYTSDDYPRSIRLPTVSDFESLISEMWSMKINEDCLRMLFEITKKLMKHSRDMEGFLLWTFTCVWRYCKANLRQWGLTVRYCTQSVSSCKILQTIITVLFEAIEMMLDDLGHALEIYINLHREQNREYEF